MSDLIQYIKDIDYLISNNIIEFSKDYFELGIIQPDQSFYGKITPILEKSLYSTYGSLIRIDDPIRFNFTNVSGKAAINTVLQALQNSSYISNYQKALNVYYGLPIVPQNCKVLGLYESYDYIVNNIEGTTIFLTLKIGSQLHKFIQEGTKLRVDRTNEELIVVTVLDRSAGSIIIDNIRSTIIGDIINVKLQNKYPIKSITEESEFIDASIIVSSDDSSEKIQHIIDIIQDVTDSKEYPEILVYGTDKFYRNYDGIYHITNAINYLELIKLNIYNPARDIEPRYNDFIFTTN